MNHFEMNFNVREEGGAVVIEVSGSINSVHSPKLREAITMAFKKKIKGMIVDLDQVNYIDSSGLATLVEAIQLSESSGTRFFISGTLDEKIQHMLEITRLTELFEHYPSTEEAVNQLES